MVLPCIFMNNHVDLTMVGLDESNTVTISKPGNSWSSMPVTDTFCPVLSRMQHLLMLGHH